MTADFTGFLTEASLLVLEQTARFAKMRGNAYFDTDDMVVGIFLADNSPAATALLTLGMTYQRVEEIFPESKTPRGNQSSEVKPVPTPIAQQVLEHAQDESKRNGGSKISPEQLLAGLLRNPRWRSCTLLRSLDIAPEAVRARLLGLKQTKASSAIPAPNYQFLAQFGRSLMTEGREGKLDPVIGRQQEIEQLVYILGRKSKNNPIILGEAGVGKTALVLGLVERLLAGEFPKLNDYDVVEIDMGAVAAGASVYGEFERRLKGIIDEALKFKVILVIDEIHAYLGGGRRGQGDASNLLKPALARGLTLIGTTTIDEYRVHIESDRGLARRFQSLTLEAPSVDETIQILKGLKAKYESHHGIKIGDDALISAARLGDRYLSDLNLPDAAIDLVDTASSRLGSAASSARETLVLNPFHIASEVKRRTGIDATELTASDAQKLLKLPQTLHERVIGQQAAIDAVTNAMRISRAGLGSKKRPIAAFLFAGPTGVGKTELAKALCQSYFGSEEFMIRLDMSEYMEKHQVSRMVGSPPGYVGYDEPGQLTDAVRRRPYTVVLFDEIEKAHPDALNMLLQILDDGRLTDNKGNVVDFTNTVLIMTSNVGSREIAEKAKSGSTLGFEFEPSPAGREASKRERSKDMLEQALQRFFRPEFLNRLQVVPFDQLSQAEVGEIIELMLKETRENLADKGITGLTLSTKAKEKLLAQGYDPVYGARAMARCIKQLVTRTLALALLEGRFAAGDKILADWSDTEDCMVFQPSKPESEKESEVACA
jgi:ATP-dependent Clp protease ATP-binding subunit ClpC